MRITPRLGYLRRFGALCAFVFVVSFLSAVKTLSFPLQSRIRQRLRSTRVSQSAVSQRQTFIVDGGELQSFLIHNGGDTLPSATAAGLRGSCRAGCILLIAGTTDESPPRRVVGVQKIGEDGSVDRYETVSLGKDEVYKHTLATVPDSVSDTDAMSTAAAAVVGIHCAIPKVEEVGGSEDGVFYSGKAVVLGGNEYAIFIADGLATLGVNVFLVSSGGVKTKNKQVEVRRPAVETNDTGEVGFASAIGQFDSLIDTIGNEQKGVVITDGNPGSVLQLLRSRHKCNKYISTLTESQQIVKNDGVLFGPGKANSHVKSMESMPTRKCMRLIPSPGFGSSTLQILLENKILYSSKNTKPTAVRGWAMKDFWEETTWPRDSSGTGVRFGLPVVEEEDSDEQFRMENMKTGRTLISSKGGMDGKEVRVQTTADDKNPYVLQLVGADGLAENVISKKRSCVVFVAMRSCRTCKGINPIFTRLAREQAGGELMFAKADATGKVGKVLGRQLGVNAVPSFVLFRKGVRYGAVSTSKLPSDRLDKAMRDMEAGSDFDTSLEEDE